MSVAMTGGRIRRPIDGPAMAETFTRYALMAPVGGLPAGMLRMGDNTLAGTRAQLAQFLAGVERRAFVLARLALAHHDDALDVVQDAMFKLVQRYAHKPAAEWPPLFFSILRRRITDVQRRRTVRRRVYAVFGGGTDDENTYDPITAAPDTHNPDPAAQVAQASALNELGTALRALPARQQQAFMLRMLEGLDVAQTARAMGCSQGSVKTHLSRALASLRTVLEPHV